MNENAVSPVVGVMLMLIVTVILAAVFAASAGSLFSDGNTESVKAEIVYAGVSEEKFIFEMKQGEPFSLKKLKLVYTLQENKTKTETIQLSGGTISIDNCRFTTQKPSFAETGNHILYSFYDIDAGTLVSSGEIPL